MEISREVAHYIVRFHDRLMTDAERRAQRHLIATIKATRGYSDRTAQKEAQNSKIYSELFSDDAEVLRLAGEGYEAFQAQTAKRIFQECGGKALLNCCPRCDALARTPKARQCRFCGCDWHERV